MMTNLRPANIRVLGIANTKTLCKWQGDWVVTMGVILNTLLVPNAAKSILSPQHFAKKYPENSTARKPCRASQFHDRCVFHLGINNERTLTIYNDGSNVPIFYSAASINAFATFMTPGTVKREDLFTLESTVLEDPIEENNNAFPVLSDNEDSISSVFPPADNHQSDFKTPSSVPRSKRSTEPLGSHTTEQNFRDKNNSEENISDIAKSN